MNGTENVKKIAMQLFNDYFGRMPELDDAGDCNEVALIESDVMYAMDNINMRNSR